MAEGSFNFRVVKILGAQGTEGAWCVYAIHRVYYDDGVPYSVSEEPASPIGGDRAELMADWALYNSALNTPVLVFNWDTGAFVGEEQEVGVVFG